MTKVFLASGFLLFHLTLFGQLTNDSATVVIEEGAVLDVNMDVNNINQSEFTNLGHLKVEGVFFTDLGSTFTQALNALCDIYGGQPAIPLSKDQPVHKRIPKNQDNLNSIKKEE